MHILGVTKEHFFISFLGIFDYKPNFLGDVIVSWPTLKIVIKYRLLYAQSIYFQRIFVATYLSAIINQLSRWNKSAKYLPDWLER